MPKKSDKKESGKTGGKKDGDAPPRASPATSAAPAAAAGNAVRCFVDADINFLYLHLSLTDLRSFMRSFVHATCVDRSGCSARGSIDRAHAHTSAVCSLGMSGDL